MFKFLNLFKYFMIMILPFLLFIIIYRMANGVNGGFDILKLRFYFQTLDFNQFVNSMKTEYNELANNLTTWISRVSTAFSGWYIRDIDGWDSFWGAMGDFFDSLGNVLGSLYSFVYYGFFMMVSAISLVIETFKMIGYFITSLFGTFDFLLKI